MWSSEPFSSTDTGAVVIPWSPLTINAEIWFDASDLDTMKQEITGPDATTPSGVGDPVGSWLNKGTLGGWATAGDLSWRPTLRQTGSLYYVEGHNEPAVSTNFLYAAFAGTTTKYAIAVGLTLRSIQTNIRVATCLGSSALEVRLIDFNQWGTNSAGGDSPSGTTLSVGPSYSLIMDGGDSGTFYTNGSSDGTYGATRAYYASAIFGEASGGPGSDCNMFQVVASSSAFGDNLTNLNAFLLSKMP